MPQISLRACEMPESPIRKLFPLAEAAKARGVKVYHLNIGQPDLPSPQTGLAALKKIDRNVLEYSPSDGYRSLREGERLTLTGLGTFSVQQKAARVGRNPRTGAAVKIPPRKAVKFRPTIELE